MSPAHFKKGLQWTTAYSCVVVFYLFVNFDFGTSLFFHQENGTQYIYSCRVIHRHLTFSGVYVCVSNAMVLLRFLLNTATSSRFHTVNKLFLKNISSVSLCIYFQSMSMNKTMLEVRHCNFVAILLLWLVFMQKTCDNVRQK